MAIKSSDHRLAAALLISNGVSTFLFLVRILATGTGQYWFLYWNLFLAWIPVLFAWLLTKNLKSRSWKSPLPIVLTFLWLAFLPNSFYLISDLIHLQNTGEIGILFDAVLFMSLIFNGLVAGMMSVYLVHKQLLKRLPRGTAHLLIGVVFTVVSFAIYLGRSLRWNTWDVLLNPAGLIFDVSDHLINPLAHYQVFITTLTFFLLLTSMYLVIWQVLINRPRD